MKKILKNKQLYLIIVIAILSILLLTSKNELFDNEFNTYFNHVRVSDINLDDNFIFYYKERSFIGNLYGFVKFDNIKDQPKSRRQYYNIWVTDVLDKNSRPVFQYNDIFKIPTLPPTIIGEPVNLNIIKIEENAVTLSDPNNNKFTFYLKNYGDYSIVESVSTIDAGGDRASLILKNNEFSTFMDKLFKK